MVQGVKMLDASPFGEASRMGSTPASSVIAVAAFSCVPSVVTIITASPFCKSANVAPGNRLNICCMSPPPEAPGRPDPPMPPAGLPASAGGRATGELFPFPLAAPSAGVPLIRMAILCANMGGSLRICVSVPIFTVMGFFATRSITVIVPALSSTALIVPAILRNVPETTSSAVNSAPSALRVPLARS